MNTTVKMLTKTLEEEKSIEIRSCAEKLLESTHLIERLLPLGTLFFTGSYALDLMTWNDLDIQILFHPKVNPIEAFSSFASAMAKEKNFLESQLIHFHGSHKPYMPRGVYLGLQFNIPELGGEWKLDLWSQTEADIEENQTLIRHLKLQLTPEKKALILKHKYRLMKEKGRMPSLASHALYQAVLTHGLAGEKEVDAFIKKTTKKPS